MEKRFIKWGIAFSLLIAIGCASIPIYSAMMGTEQPMAGATVLLDKYCSSVASGATVATPMNKLLSSVATPVPTKGKVVTKKLTPAPTKAPAHVALNLNYSRLGIASKVDTYLNVRKKASEKSKVTGKLIKNAGCHVYSIKKGWAKIVSGKVKGYVKASYMTFDKKAERLATKVGKTVAVINTPALMVRQLPSTKSHTYSVVALEEEFEIKSQKLTMAFVKKVIKKNKISAKKVNAAGGYTGIQNSLSNWICIKVDDEYAFVAKAYVKVQYSLRRAVKIGKLQASASSGVTSGQVSVVEFAKQFLGNRYVWGGTNLTNGTDCSGFVLSIYAHFGHGLPRTAASQCAAVATASGSPRPGDLFFYSNGSRVNHVAMYIGSGMVIHASNPTDGIKISNAYYRQPVKIGRVLN